MPLIPAADRRLRAYASNRRGDTLVFLPDEGAFPAPTRDPSIRVEGGRIFVEGVLVGTVADAVAECAHFDALLFRWAVL